MPIRYTIDVVHRRLLTHADGIVTFHDINAHLDAEQRNRDLGRPELIDARGATGDISAEDVRRLVRRAADMAQTPCNRGAGCQSAGRCRLAGNDRAPFASVARLS